MPEQILTLESVRSTLSTMANVLYDQVKPVYNNPSPESRNLVLTLCELDKLVKFIEDLEKLK